MKSAVPNIDINPVYWREVVRLLRQYVPEFDVWAFGSRVKWTAKSHSDLDLAIITTEPLSLNKLAELKEVFDESVLPFRVDIVDWAATSESFRRIIERDKLVIQSGQTSHMLSTQFPVFPLEECLEALIDYRGKTPEKTSSGIPLVTAKVIKGGRIEPPTEFVAPGDYDLWMRRGLPNPGDVVMTTEAPLGEVAQLGHEKVALAQRVITLRGKAGFLDNTYLLYLLQTEEMQEQLKARATGTTVLGIKQSELRKISVRVPPFGLQRSITSILKSLDDRIALLRETNVTLEAIAQALFKSWFVDFDPVHAKQQGRAPEGMDEATAALFPDSFEESELGLVPMGWRVGTLGDISITARKQLQPSELHSELHYVGLEHIPRKSLSLTDWDNAAGLESAKAAFSKGDILFGKLRPYFHKVVIAPFDGVCSTDILVCQPKKPAYFGITAMLLFSTTLIDYAERLSNGAKMPRVNWKDLAVYPISIPPEALAENFCKAISPLIQRMTANVHQAQTLSTLRDTLLPRLISGQLRLPEAEALIEEIA